MTCKIFSNSRFYCGGLKGHRRQTVRIMVTLVSAIRRSVRMLRAIRFAGISFGFELEPKTAATDQRNGTHLRRPYSAARLFEGSVKLHGSSGNVSKPLLYSAKWCSISYYFPDTDAYLKGWTRWYRSGSLYPCKGLKTRRSNTKRKTTAPYFFTACTTVASVALRHDGISSARHAATTRPLHQAPKHGY